MSGTTIPNARRISSPLTQWYKKMFPVFWIAITFLMVAELVFLNFYAREKPPILVDLIPVLMAAIGVCIMRWLIGNLNDQVWDASDRLIVVNRGASRDIPLSSIVNVSHTVFTDPLCIRLTLRNADKALDEVTFCPWSAAAAISSIPCATALPTI